MRRILVLRGGALGDFIVTLPALALLRQRWPRAVMELAGNPSAADIARRRGLLQAVHAQSEARWAALYSPAPLPSALADWLGKFDLIVCYWPDADGVLARHFPIRPDQVFIGHPCLPTRGPAAAHFAEALAPLGLPAPEPFCFLGQRDVQLGTPHGSSAGQGEPDGSGRWRVVLHPGSGSPRKNWPLGCWMEIAVWLRRTYPVDIVVCAGEAEEGPRLGVIGTVRTGMTLEELEEMLRGARLFLGHDSGVSHLAAACGVRSVLLFGPTDPAIWAPPAGHVRVVHRPGPMPELPVHDVRAAIVDALS